LCAHVTAVHAHGHAAGHTAFQVSSDVGDTILIWGDIVHVPSIQFARPELTWEYDANQAEARSTRQRFLERAVQPGLYVAGAHLPFPGLGTVTRHGEAFHFNPL
jgi:glyoxylase-like metal-dependent hydrolase (beta-lactamase superfamily II)